jgi:hypothetical protein
MKTAAPKNRCFNHLPEVGTRQPVRLWHGRDWRRRGGPHQRKPAWSLPSRYRSKHRDCRVPPCVRFLFFLCYTAPLCLAQTVRDRAGAGAFRDGGRAVWQVTGDVCEDAEGRAEDPCGDKPFGCMGLFFMFSVCAAGNVIGRPAAGRMQRR